MRSSSSIRSWSSTACSRTWAQRRHARYAITSARRRRRSRQLSLAAIPASARWPWRFESAMRARWTSRTLGIASKAGEARAISARSSGLAAAVARRIPRVAKIACDVKSAMLALARHGHRRGGFEHDVMLYAFLLDADPSGCSLADQAQRRLDLKLGPSPEQQADCALELYEKLSPGDRRARAAAALRNDGPAAHWRPGAHGADRHPHRSGRAASGSPILMETRIQRLTAEILRAGRQAVQHQLAATIRQSFV